MRCFMALNDSLLAITRRFWPELDTLNEQRRLVGVGDVFVFLITIPLSFLGLFWLAVSTDWELLGQAWPAFFLFVGLIIIFNQVRYFFIIEVRTDRYGSAEGSLGSMIQWSAVLIFGPSFLWLSVITNLVNFVWTWRKPHSPAAGWSQLRSLSLDLCVSTIAYLGALQFYTHFGGVYPIQALSIPYILPALTAQALQFLIILLIWLPYIVYSIWIQVQLTQSNVIKPILRFILLALGLPLLAHPFAILVAGLYVQNGPAIALFFILGLLLVAYLGRQLSWAAETSRQQSRMLEKLEQLGRDIINAPPDASTLPDLLEAHVPTMFPSGRVAVWMDADQYLYKNPPDWGFDIESIWDWVRDKKEAQSFRANHDLPWGISGSQHDPVVLTPILSVDNGTPIGCVVIELRSLAQPWDIRALHSLYPAVQSLAASIASALYQAEVYAENLQYQSAMQELEFAGRIQASFLPNELPDMDGWELSVTLLPARETSGDFFDFIQLADGKVGIMVADVADKGLGAALYMALSRTLIRTYALEYQGSPDIIFFSANERVLQDASANLFVTAFYGILDPTTGMLTYCNAGHSPPFLFSRRDGGIIHALTPTGMPIGIDEDATWTQAMIQIEPGDVLMLYTDGIPDAQNMEGTFFSERSLIEMAEPWLDSSSQDIQIAVVEAVQEFTRGASQFDDITLLVLKRDLPSAAVNPDRFAADEELG